MLNPIERYFEQVTTMTVGYLVCRSCGKRFDLVDVKPWIDAPGPKTSPCDCAGSGAL